MTFTVVLILLGASLIGVMNWKVPPEQDRHFLAVEALLAISPREVKCYATFARASRGVPGNSLSDSEHHRWGIS